MIRKVVQCDVCNEQADLPIYLIVGSMEALPDGWLRVSGKGAERHFCSDGCVGRFYEQPKVETKRNDGVQLCLEL